MERDISGEIEREIRDLPTKTAETVLDFIRFLRARATKQAVTDTMLASEEALKDWLGPEEEEAWRDL